MDTLRQFSSFGFHVSLLIVDGASSNLTTLKLLIGVRGVFGHDDSLEDKHYDKTMCSQSIQWKEYVLTHLPLSSGDLNLTTMHV